MGSTKKPEAAFALSLIAGLLILINGITLGAVASFLPLIQMGRPSDLPIAATILNTLMIVGIILGIIVLVSAVMLYRNPTQKTMWGTIILVLSIVSIFIGGGFGLGLILGIIGGILALRWKPK